MPIYEKQAQARMLAGKKNPSLDIGEAPKGKAAEHAAKAVNVSRASVESALRVKRDGSSEVQDAMKRGVLAVSAAAGICTGAVDVITGRVIPNAH